MSGLVTDLLQQLEDDMICHGWLLHCVAEEQERNGSESQEWLIVLEELLKRGVAIGTAKEENSDYVVFIAWSGPVAELLGRASTCVNSVPAEDRDFAYWLALRKNVDRFED